MKAARIHAYGPPSVLRIEEVPVPEAGPTEALVKVAACGVSYHDVVERQGLLDRGSRFPQTIGYEIAGTVERVGELVRTLAPGDRVCCKPHHSCGLCRYCRTGMETSCVRRRPVRGGHAQYAAIPEEALVRLPAEIGFEAACMLGASAAVALNAVRDVACVRPGETVLVTGASGGLGLPSIEVAKAAGAIVIAATRSAEKCKALTEHGADHVVVTGDTGDFSPQVLALTDDLGVDVVIDNVGSRVFDASFRSLAQGGRYAFVGQLFRERISINPARIFFKRAHLIGVGSARRDQLEDAVKLVRQGKIRPRVACELPLEEVVAAHALVEAGSLVGRVVLRP